MYGNTENVCYILNKASYKRENASCDYQNIASASIRCICCFFFVFCCCFFHNLFFNWYRRLQYLNQNINLYCTWAVKAIPRISNITCTHDRSICIVTCCIYMTSLVQALNDIYTQCVNNIISTCCDSWLMYFKYKIRNFVNWRGIKHVLLSKRRGTCLFQNDPHSNNKIFTHLWTFNITIDL